MHSQKGSPKSGIIDIHLKFYIFKNKKIFANMRQTAAI